MYGYILFNTFLTYIHIFYKTNIYIYIYIYIFIRKVNITISFIIHFYFDIY